MAERTVTVRFARREVELVAEALHRFQPESAADRLSAVRMRDLIDDELGKDRRR